MYQSKVGYMRWIAYLFLFVFPQCGKEIVLLPPNESVVPQATLACQKILSCNLMEFEQLDTCVKCMLRLYDDTELVITRDLVTMTIIDMPCEDIRASKSEYLMFQCIQPE
jgi:hypothetical protein